MNKGKESRFKISWDKLLNDSRYETRYTPTIDKQDLYRGFYLSAKISPNGDFIVEAQENGMYGHLKPKVLIEKGNVQTLGKAKRKVREIFVKLTDTYD